MEDDSQIFPGEAAGPVHIQPKEFLYIVKSYMLNNSLTRSSFVPKYKVMSVSMNPVRSMNSLEEWPSSLRIDCWSSEKVCMFFDWYWMRELFTCFISGLEDSPITTLEVSGGVFILELCSLICCYLALISSNSIWLKYPGSLVYYGLIS